MRILLVTDAWHPQINGVTNTWSYIINHLKNRHDIFVLNPYIEDAEQLPVKLQGNIPLVKNASCIARKYYMRYMPDRVHIATEGSLGFAMRQFCRENKINYNTSYHTSLADYGWVLYGIPRFMTWIYVRWFHKNSRKVLVTTKSISRQLALKNSIVWGRGVDTGQFRPLEINKRSPRKTIITVGRVSKDKNLDDFCSIRGYRKILVGDGPYLKTLRSRYKDVEFTGSIPHGKLTEIYNEADVFVFPSRYDTFGLVILEAMACGLPVAAYDVPSPSDIVQNGVTGILGGDLEENVALSFEGLHEMSDNAVRFAQTRDWQSIADQFVEHLM